MTGRTLAVGDVVRTPAGESGRIIRRSANALTVPLEYERFDLDGKADLIVYSVLLQSGEVRKYSFDALVL